MPEEWRKSIYEPNFTAHSGVLPSCRLELSLDLNDLKNGSRGRARTYNITVNSRALYH
jgi:hypothetical protein